MTSTPPPGSGGVDAWFNNNLSPQHKDWLIKKFYQLELDTIRRPKPLLGPDEHPYSIHKVGLYDRNQAASSPQTAPQRLRDRWDEAKGIKPTGQVSAKPATAGLTTKDDDNVVHLIDNDDNDDGRRGRTVTGPSAGLRQELQKVRRTLGYTDAVDHYFAEEIHEALKHEYKDQEEILHQPEWRDYVRSKHGRDSTTLVKGFPMVEDVVFLKHRNHWSGRQVKGIKIEDGQCYWLSIALLIYGTPRAWLRVKAEHLSYLERALLDKDHPRYDFYNRELQSKPQTKATSKDGRWKGPVDLWEMLQLPGCWVNEDVGFLTADVYGVFLVLYKYSSDKKPEWKEKVYDMKTFGSFNARHIFLCYINGNHYQPMVPNDYYAYEFKLPRLMLQTTRKYNLETRERTGRFAGDGPKHHYRSNVKSIPGVTVQPWFTRDHLTMAVGTPQRSELPSGTSGSFGKRPLPSPSSPPSKRQHTGTPQTHLPAPGSAPSHQPQTPIKTGTGLPATPLSGTQPSPINPTLPQATSSRTPSAPKTGIQDQEELEDLKAEVNRLQKETSRAQDSLKAEFLSRQAAEAQIAQLRAQLAAAQGSQAAAAQGAQPASQGAQTQPRLKSLYTPLPTGYHYAPITRDLIKHVKRERIGRWAWELDLSPWHAVHTTGTGGAKKEDLIKKLMDNHVQVAIKGRGEVIEEKEGEEKGVVMVRFDPSRPRPAPPAQRG
ncbi:hypothetical protein VTJ49DRAFT_5648 [Mycothermus thermophilus]|uniref:OTU domain-containing protein n=1 Tax=Humicola insolens TaxID=85995 RepID=A0ABR3VKP5_HUMIN